jgi:hypothetical protein
LCRFLGLVACAVSVRFEPGSAVAHCAVGGLGHPPPPLGALQKGARSEDGVDVIGNLVSRARSNISV